MAGHYIRAGRADNATGPSRGRRMRREANWTDKYKAAYCL